VAALQDRIRNFASRAHFVISTKTEPPECVSVPFTTIQGIFVADSIYMRVLVENTGHSAAQNAEVYAKSLRVKRADETWERVNSFPPMNLKWANLGFPYANIAPGMAKHCDIAHIVDPAQRHHIGAEYAPALGLTPQQTSLAFDLIAVPNNKTHIVPPGEYELDIQIAAENAPPILRTLRISIKGTWDADPERMMRNGVGISVKGD
jgi:hypothetical protein